MRGSFMPLADVASMSVDRNRIAALALTALVLVPHCEKAESASASSPEITFVGGTAEQHQRMQDAIRRFTDAGVVLPALTVEFGTARETCNGHHGVFRPRSMTIAICSEVDSVFEHELAHAWERTTITDDTRNAFMAVRGYEVWSDHEVPWNRRGVEGAAFVIQQGLSTVPLPPALGDEFTSRMQAFELLTGVPAPRLAAWMAQRSVPCEERPTPLSERLVDADSMVCS